MNETVIVGQQEAGRAYEVRKQLYNIAQNIEKDTFSMARLLWEVRKNGMWSKWGYPSMGTYTAQELKVKPSRARYLTRIIEVMEDYMGMEGVDYQHLGISKLRIISRLDPTQHMSQINQLVSEASAMTLEQVDAVVRQIQGLVGENALVTRSYTVPEGAYKVIEEAMELMRRHLGSKGRDDEGKAVEYSDGRCLELICAEFLNNPNNYEPVENEE
jgi:hypothetical protein